MGNTTNLPSWQGNISDSLFINNAIKPWETKSGLTPYERKTYNALLSKKAKVRQGGPVLSKQESSQLEFFNVLLEVFHEYDTLLRSADRRNYTGRLAEMEKFYTGRYPDENDPHRQWISRAKSHYRLTTSKQGVSTKRALLEELGYTL